MVDLTENNKVKDELINELSNSSNDGENGLDIIVISKPTKPSTRESADVQRPNTFERTSTEAKEHFDAGYTIKRPCSVQAIINYEGQANRSHGQSNNNAEDELGSTHESYVIKTPQLDCYFEQTADHLGDYSSGQPQKLSFEDELTFIPKLNSLSLRIAQSRSSVARRIKLGYESRVAALEEEMAQNFTFKPSISENSSKIADRLKTDFWTRQRLHTERQRKMV